MNHTSLNPTYWPLAIGALALLTLVLPSCAGTDGNQVEPHATPSGVVSSAVMPPPLSSSAEPTANAMSPEPAVDLRPQRWTRAVAEAGDSQVQVYGTLTSGPPCVVLGQVDVAETDDSVQITLMVGMPQGATCGPQQPDLGYPFVTQVRLKAPLGARTIVDGAA